MKSNLPLAYSTAIPSAQVSRRQFFFEESGPEGARNVRTVYAPVQRLGCVISASAPWEGQHVSNFCGTLVRLDDGRLRLYYSGYTAGLREFWLAVAESSDGLKWDKPSLGQVRVAGHDTNRLQIEGLPKAETGPVQPQVVRLPSGEYRMYFWNHHPQGHEYFVAHSADGLRWNVGDPRIHPLNNFWLGDADCFQCGWAPGTGSTQSLPSDQVEALWRKKALRTNDAVFIYYNPLRNRFESFSPWIVAALPDRRVDVDNCPGVHRLMQRRLSLDGLSWGPPELIIMPDSRDPWDLQFYHLAVQWHEDWLIGSLGHYRVEDGQQTQDWELAFSRDGRRWHRPVRGAFVPRSASSGVSECAGIYPGNAWLDEGATWLGLYTSTPLPHNRSADLNDSRQLAIMAARWGKNRFVGLGADRVGGGFLSGPISVQGETITVDAEIRGELRAELCDVFGRKLPGYHLMDSMPVKGDNPAHVLRWKNRGTEGFRHDIVRVRFEFADGEIYGLGF